MKTLLITSLYSKLWGTEYGGRPSREHHYKVSLLNILNLNPTKIICFTSPKEIDELSSFFYDAHKVDRNLLELRSFNLADSKFFDEIRSKKDLEKMKTVDRCYEIQYNKFFWFDLIQDRYSYDKVYWIDAGLSHGGLFPGEYRDGSKGYDSNFTITLFRPEFLNKLNEETKDKINVLSKTNAGRFYWSQTIPRNYYTAYNNSKHIIGGMFGGNPEKYEFFVREFEKLLTELLDKESKLYMEEMIMSCLFVKHNDHFIPREFDDWYKRENHQGTEYKYFYELFL